MDNLPPIDARPGGPRKKPQKPLYSRWWFWVLLVLIIPVISSMLSKNPPSKSTSTPVPTVSQTPVITLSPEEQAAADKKKKANFITSCQKIDYKELARNPDDYVGVTNVYFRGQVTQVIKESSTNKYLVYVTQDSYGLWDDPMYIEYVMPEGASRILEDDIVDIYGVSAGLVKYTTVMGAEKTVPAVNAQYIDLVK